jgi:thiol-disulfide isomerase/thioredoxin
MIITPAIIRRITTVALAALAIGAQRAFAQEGGIAVGAMAPAAAVQTLDGKAADLSQYIGKTPVVLEFWATWCPLCKKLEPAMQAAREKYAGKVTFVSVGVKDNQTAAKQMAYVNDMHMSGAFVFDADGKAVAAYKAPHTSYVVVIDKAGKVVYTGVGPEQNIDEAVSKATMSMMKEER